MNRVVPRHEGFWMTESHHYSTSTPFIRTDVKESELDLCASIECGGMMFRPLVRDTYALGCSLNIIFLRNEPIGRVYQGGDLDNRLKTLLDSLTVPTKEQIRDTAEERMHVLLEDDSRVTGLSVDTRRLLTKADANDKEVRLVIEVTVSVLDARAYNTLFLGD